MSEKDFGLVISDYDIGKGKDGQQLLEEARYTKSVKAVSSFVLLTAESSLDKVIGAIEYEPDEYIVKPFTLNILTERLNKLWKTKEVLQAVNEAIDQENMALAIDKANQLLNLKSSFLLPISRVLGKLSIESSECQNALKLYASVLDYYPTTWAKFGYAVCLHHTGDSDSALTSLREILNDHPLCVQCYDWLGDIQTQKESWQAAQEAFENAVFISPRSVRRQMRLGNIAMRNESYLTAQSAFEHSIRYGRFSCFKTENNYIQYVELIRNRLVENTDSSREKQTLGKKALRILEELRKDYSERLDLVFYAHISCCHIYLLLDDMTRARSAASHSESTYTKLESPSDEQTEQLEDVLKKTGRLKHHEKLDFGSEGVSLTEEECETEEVESQEPTVNEEYSDELNSKGVEYYKQGMLKAAVKAFDQATSYSQATTSVLLNSIQAKVSHMEKYGANLKMLKECYLLSRRIGSLRESDSRFERYQKLRNSCKQLGSSIEG